MKCWYISYLYEKWTRKSKGDISVPHKYSKCRAVMRPTPCNANKKSSIFQIVTSCKNYRYIQFHEITFSLFQANLKSSTFQITSCHNYRHICFMNDFYVLERLSLYGTMGVWNKILPSKLFHYLDFSAKHSSEFSIE